MSISRIKKGDQVIAISGVSAGKSGKVLFVDTEKNRVVVENLNVIKKTVKRSEQNKQGGTINVEASIALSSLMPLDPETGKGVRISRVKDGDRNVRRSKKSTHIFD